MRACVFVAQDLRVDGQADRHALPHIVYDDRGSVTTGA
jgi:hypothetical protein